MYTGLEMFFVVLGAYLVGLCLGKYGDANPNYNYDYKPKTEDPVVKYLKERELGLHYRHNIASENQHIHKKPPL